MIRAAMFVCFGLAGLGQTVALGQTLPSFEKAAEKAQAAAVTVRIGNPTATRAAGDEDSDETSDSDSSEQRPLPQVTVFSGVSLGDGLLVTPLFAGKDVRLRVTVAGGEQAKAKPLVLDQFCGLALLEMDRSDVPEIELAENLPKVGSWVISAAAWGVEKPIVSFGMVSGVDRNLPAGNFPPVLQCNLTTVESSSGAGVVNQEGKLVGIIVAADPPSRQRGWAYAVPVKHVQRLLRAREGKLPKNQRHPVEDKADDSVIVLQSRRPHVGMMLEGNADDITVARVKKGGPAERAGIRAGDKVLAVDGIKIRSVYQATRPTLSKQPGDKLTFLVRQADGTRKIAVTLGGGVAVPSAQVGKLFEPKVVVESIADFRVPAPLSLPRSSQLDSNETVPLSKLPPGDLLKLAVDRYQTVIELQRGQLHKQDRELFETIKQYKAAAEENRRLKSRIDTLQKNESR